MSSDSSLLNTDEPTSETKYTIRHGSDASPLPPGNLLWDDAALRSRPFSGVKFAVKHPATTGRSTSHQPSERSETTLLDEFFDRGALDKIPPTIVPALLQNVDDVSPSRSTFDNTEGESHKVDEDSDLRDALPRFSIVQKGEWKIQTDGDIVQDGGQVRSESPEFHFPSMEPLLKDWVSHNQPILQEYADRQVSLPLGQRLQVSIHEPSQFILGALQLLVNRDKSTTHHSRQLGPQQIGNFVDINHWVKEYFRYQHAIQAVNSDVLVLLEIVLNGFYEGQVQLIDQLVHVALRNMRSWGRHSPILEDFALGFDFRMSQDLPFYVETSSRLRKALPIRTVKLPTTGEPVTTSSGRQVKLSERAREAVEPPQKTGNARRNKGNISQVTEKQAATGSATSAPKKSTAQSSSNHTVPGTSNVGEPDSPETSCAHTKHRPTRPSNLGLPPISHGSPLKPGTIPPEVRDSVDSEPTQEPTSADDPKASESTNHKTSSPLHLKIRLRGLDSTDAGPSDSGLTLGNTDAQRRASRQSTRTRLHRRGRECGNESKTQIVQAHEATSVHPNEQLTAQSANSAVDTTTSVTHPTTADTGDKTANARAPKADNSTGKPQGKPPSDPGHPRKKKRKLDDCDD